MTRKSFAVAVLILGSLVVGERMSAQSVAIPEIPAENFSLAKADVHLSLKGLRPNSDYVIGVKVTDAGTRAGSIEVGDLVASAFAKDHTRPRFESLNPIAKQNLQIANGSISISQLDSLRGHLYVLLSMPADASLTLVVNDTVKFVGTTTNGTIIHAGKVVANTFEGRHELIARLLYPEMDEPQPDVTRSWSGLSASQQGLAKHLLSFTMPANHPEFISGERSVVQLAIKIDPAGKVTDVKSHGGYEPFLSETVNAVKNAQFTPFTANGSPVPIESEIIVVFQKNGRVVSSLR